MKHLSALLLTAISLPLFGETLMKQDFENSAFFEKRTANGYTDRDPIRGQWIGVNMVEQFKITDEQAAGGKQSLKFTYTGQEKFYPTGLLLEPYGGSVEAEVWCYREPEFRFAVAVAGPVGDKARADLGAVGVFDPKVNQFTYMNYETGKWVRTGLKCPAEEWVKITIRIDQKQKQVRYFATVNDQVEALGTTALPENAKARFIEFRRIPSTVGASGYFDDVTISKLSDQKL